MMEMSAELTADVLENILRHGKFNIPTKNAMENAVRLLKEQEEVVRCGDCKHYDSFSQECRNGIDGIMTPNFYCGNAERKDSE